MPKKSQKSKQKKSSDTKQMQTAQSLLIIFGCLIAFIAGYLFFLNINKNIEKTSIEIQKQNQEFNKQLSEMQKAVEQLTGRKAADKAQPSSKFLAEENGELFIASINGQNLFVKIEKLKFVELYMMNPRQDNLKTVLLDANLPANASIIYYEADSGNMLIVGDEIYHYNASSNAYNKIKNPRNLTFDKTLELSWQNSSACLGDELFVDLLKYELTKGNSPCQN